jgi:hypothetical protein
MTKGGGGEEGGDHHQKDVARHSMLPGEVVERPQQNLPLEKAWEGGVPLGRWSTRQL